MPRVGLPAIAAIAIGTLVGGVAQLALQWPLLRREGFRYRPTLDWNDAGLRRVLVLMGPGTIGVAATQVNVFVNTVLATSEGTGAVSWLNFAFRLMYLPIGLFGVSIATATLPAVSRHAARGRQGSGARHDRRRHVADADAERAGDGRPDRPGHADRAPHLRARRLHRRRHGRHRRGAAVLCARPARLLGRAHRVAGVLRARRGAHAGDGEHRDGARQRRAEHPARSRAGIPRARARHVDRGAVQRDAAADPAPAPPRRARRRPRGGVDAQDRRRVGADGRHGVRAGRVAADAAARQRPRSAGDPPRRVDRRGARSCWRLPRTCCTSASSGAGWRS